MNGAENGERTTGNGKDEWGLVHGWRNDEGQRYCTTEGKFSKDLGPADQANFSIPSSRFPVDQFPFKASAK